MPTSRDLPSDRPAVGQLLGRLLREFRKELFAGAALHGYGDIRGPHLQITGNVGIRGIRLTELASRSQLSLATTSELVSDLERLGYLERRPDPHDGRARLIFPTPRGRQTLDHAGDRVAEIEQRWGGLVGAEDFEGACQVMARLLTALEPQEAALATPGADPGVSP